MNFFSSHNKQANQTKAHWLLALSLSLMLITQTAHADFRKALDAYQKRDGDTLLKEVKDAVDKKNDEGLVLFLHAMRIDANTSAKSNLYESFKDKRPIKTTLDFILTPPQRQELFDSLSISANANSSTDVQYLYAGVQKMFGVSKTDNWAKTIDEYAKKGSYVANAFNTDLLARAQAGDPFSQLSIGLKYLNFVDYAGYGCQQNSKEQICQTKDEVKGYALLKQALKTYEKRGHDNLGIYADSMCELFQNTANGDKTKLRQAYLWCVVGINSGGLHSRKLLNEINAEGLEKDFNILNIKEFKTLPDWMVETRKEIAKERLPVFSYYADDYMEYEIDVYEDGIVKIGFGSVNNGLSGHESGNISFVDIKKDLLMKVSPKKVKIFLADLKKTGFYTWSLNNQIGIPFCDNFDASHCLPKRYQVTTRDGIKGRRIYLDGLVWDIAKIGVGRDKETAVTKRIAKITTLVEKHFPTQNLRCVLNNSEEYKQACLQRASRWITLTKEEK